MSEPNTTTTIPDPTAPVGDAAPGADTTQPASADGTQDSAAATGSGNGAAAATAAPATAQLGQLEGDAKGEPAKATQAAPADITVKLPEGVNDPALEEALKATKGDPQKVVEAIYASQQQAKTAGEAELVQAQKTWIESMKADPEFGGVKYADNLKAADDALGKHWPKEFVELVKSTYLRNHPGFLKGLASVGNATKDSRVSGANGTTAGAEPSLDDQLKDYFHNSPEMFSQR
jgi:hypothetical protein